MNPELRVAILHYHLNPGGVTRVINHTLSALADHPVKVAALCGSAPCAEQARPGLPVGVHESLRYGSVATATEMPAIEREIRTEARRLLGGAPDLWHIHNHAIGKNVTLPLLASRFAAAGEALLLQIHDFAEDGRPTNYAWLQQALKQNGVNPHAVLYPTNPRTHYALLNRRDLACLRNAGLPHAQAHLLSNPVPPFPPLPEAPERDYIVYPTRAIRRKNLGEFLLWAAIDGGNSRFAVTLAPRNPTAKPVYDQWVRFAHRLKLPVSFEVGRDQPFTAILARARFCMTTSIAEGFGLAFLEPWIAHRALAGRNLPEITADFGREGIDLSMLYEHLTVPEDWVAADRLRANVRDAMAGAYAAYGRALPDQAVESAMAAARHHGGIDFGCLDEGLQASIIERITASPHEATAITPHVLPDPAGAAQCLDSNARAIHKVYNLEAYAQRLLRLYETALGSNADAGSLALDPEALLRQFLAPERFMLLRS